jgi:dinuclear metal center YbgI/SA1388 family protein
MIPKLKDILELLENLASARLAEPWDNPGLQVGSFSQDITKIFISLDPTLKALRSAQKRNAQLLLTHHPLIFKPLSQLEISTYPGNVIFEAIKDGIAVVAAHTNLDTAWGGINDILADLFELKDVEILKEVGETSNFGLGRIGDLPEPMKVSLVIKKAKAILGAEKLKIVGQGDALINRIAIVGGAGGSLVSLAYKKGADLILTGDVSHHNALEAESLGMALIDGGHFRMEKVAFDIFADRLRPLTVEQGWDITVEIDKDENDPMRHG